MTNKKSTKKALLFSVLSLVLCFSMLVGTTFAWFTDSVTSANNIIQSGNLDITLEYWNGTAWVDVEGSSEILDKDAKWEPGYVEDVYLRIKNAGSLALKYQLGVNIVAETAGVNAANQPFKLSDYIYFDVVEGQQPTFANRDAAMAYATETTKISAGYATSGTLAAASDYVYLAMVVYMPETVGNDANHKTGTTAPKIELGINIVATQVTAESDAFGSDYDKDAAFVTAPVERPENATTGMNLKGANDVVINLPAEVINDLPEGVEEIGMAVSDPVVDANNNTVSFAAVELVDQNGDIIDLDNLNTNANITVTLPLPEDAPFAAYEEVMVYHDGVYVGTAVVDANGNITYTVAHLCEVTVGAIEEPTVNGDTVEIANVAQLVAFANTVNSGKDSYAGKTVVLTADIDLNNVAWTPVGNWDYTFDGNFNGQGHKIMNLNMSDDTAANDYAYLGFFGITAENIIEDVVFENVTVNSNGQIVAAAIAYPYYTTVKDITVCGDIAINGGNYTAGVLAYTRHCIDASNLTVNGNKGSYITGAQVVGGVISDIQINGAYTADYSNFSASNLTITGTKMVGGISGIISKQTLNGATVENVELVCSDARVGIIAGCVDSKPVINNVEYTNVTGTTSIVGASYDSASKAYVVIDGVECAANAAAFKEQLETGTVNLAGNIALNESVTIASGKTVVINLNGNTISGTCTASQGYLFMVNNGAKLTVLDSSEAQTGKITFAQGTSNVGWAIDLEGELVLESGTIELTGDSWSIGYCVDVRPNAWGTAYTNPTVFTMNGGKVVSSDGAIRVASSSSDTYTGVSAKFVMNGGEVEAAWDGIFVQQSNTIYDILTVELNGGKVASALSPVRVYGPIATSVVGGAEKPMTLTIGANAELSVIGEIDTSRTWYKDGVVVLGGGMTVEALNQYATIVIAE